MSRTILRGATLPRGEVADVAVDSETSLITEIGQISAGVSDTVEDCSGMMMLPAPVEPHAHLDKALLNESEYGIQNPKGDLAGAIDAMRMIRLHPEDVFNRAKLSLLEMVANGTTLIRTHVDVREAVGTSSLRALGEVARWANKSGLAELQIACLIGTPITGARGKENRRLLSKALDDGADVIGGCPYLEDDPKKALSILMDAAFDANKPLDLHTDETLDPKVFTIIDLIDAVGERGVGAGVTASHCVSLSMQDPDLQFETGRRLGELGISVIVLPQTNLYLQARGISQSPPRGIAPISLLREIGVTVAAGSDNARDPFCSVGRMDMLETAGLLVLGAHMRPDDAWYACSAMGRRVLGYPEADISVGSIANLLLIEGPNLASAIAKASAKRYVVHRGQMVVRSTVEREFVSEMSTS